ncbi:synaptic vesicle glycoprotein 2B-like [Coccinella septempunctata]|uniref:synaptic vesicle glycoprotein 2B-like n=1 Tax=Coccinella septempunctata TaxID=41139 RepID=UPI001D0602F4|nr:synaptic vesicle glycoprotein 2B-like [Coccinella septempunctata]
MKNFLKNLRVFGDCGENAKAEYDASKPADFETALGATGFGKFNFLLFLIAFPTCWAVMFQTTTMSFVFPAAQCDLNLTLEDKGLLNGVTFAGTVVSAFIWGFLFDTFGRRKLLIIGFFLDGLTVILSAVSQDIIFLMITKFLGGIIVIGPFAALTPYLSELHVAKYRSRIPLVMGACFAIGGIYLPFIASLILPLNFEQVLAENFVLHSWSLFLFVNAIPSLLGALLLYYLPESPKFLMSVGKHEEALEVFRRIYSLNSGFPPENYPIKELVKEETRCSQSSWLSKSCSQLGPLFGKYLKLFLLVCFLNVLITTSFNTFRLWLPQLFQAITDYKYYNNGTSASLCEMLSILRRGNEPKECFVNFENFDVYLNAMWVCLTSLTGYLIAGSLVNILGQNKLLAITSFLAGLCSIGIYFSPNSLLSTVFMAGFYSLCSIATNTTSLVVINLFPTSIRTTSLSLAFMFARIFSMVGNVIFPYLINMGCEPPFVMLAVLVFTCSILTLILPEQKNSLQ